MNIFGNDPELVLRGDGVDVYAWSVEGQVAPRLLCTVGMSEAPQLVPEGNVCPSAEPRTELMCYCSTSEEETIARVLNHLAAYPFAQRTFFFWWHTLPLGQPLFPTATVDAALLTIPPFAPNEVTFQVEGTRRDLIWVVPLCNDEFQFCRSKGIDEFENILDRAEVDLANFTRPPIV